MSDVSTLIEREAGQKNENMRMRRHLLLLLACLAYILLIRGIRKWNKAPSQRSTMENSSNKNRHRRIWPRRVRRHKINAPLVNPSLLGDDFEDEEDDRECSPKDKIVFAKTHKTGSTTVQNILLRYGVSRNLTFAFPPGRRHIYTPTANVKVDHLLRHKNVEYDIHAFHGKWNIKVFNKIIPKAFRVTILREPVSCFESMYSYYRLGRRTNLTVNEFAIQIASKNPTRSLRSRHGKDNQLYDLGLSAANLEIPAKVDEKVNQLSKEFDLVMMTEFFEESLILLREAMCWSFRDIAYIAKNKRAAKRKRDVTDEASGILKEWLWAEFKLYDFFRERFLEKVDDYGKERMEKDKERLKAANQRLEHDCFYRRKGWIACQILKNREIPTIRMLRRWQASKLWPNDEEREVFM